MNIAPKTTFIHQHSNGSIALVTAYPEGDATVAWPEMREGRGLEDIRKHHEGATSRPAPGEPINPSDHGNAMSLRQAGATYINEGLPVSMEQIGRLENGRLRLWADLSPRQREYLGIPEDWRGDGPDTFLIRKPDGTLEVRRNALEGRQDVAGVTGKGKDGIATLLMFQEGRKNLPIRSEQKTNDDATRLVTVRQRHLWIYLGRLQAEEARYLGMDNDDGQTSNAPP